MLVAYSKIGLTATVLASDVPDDAWFAVRCAATSPTGSSTSSATGWPVTRCVGRSSRPGSINDLVNRGGMTFVYRVQEETGASAVEAVRAYSVVREVFRLEDYWGSIEALDNVLPTTVQSMLYLESRRLLDRSIRWLVQQRRATIDVAHEVEHFQPAFDELVPRLPALLVGAERERLLMRAAEFAGLGVPDELADRAAGLLDGFSLLDVVEIANAEKLPALEVAGVYFAISERIEADRMLTRITGLPRDDRWSALARSALRYDLYAAMAGLTQNVLTSTSSGDEPARADHVLGAAERRGCGARGGHAQRDREPRQLRPRDALRRPAHHPHPAAGLSLSAVRPGRGDGAPSRAP